MIKSGAMMRHAFDIKNWFWVVGGDESRAWSSAAGSYVPEWCEDRATRITTEEELAGILAGYGRSIVRPDVVNEERNRRIFSGFTFNGSTFQSRLEDQKRISGASILAAVAIMSGAKAGDLRWHGGDSDFAWIAADNVLVPMDAHTVIAFGQAAARHETLHVFAARALKDMTPIPFDYASDRFWP